MSIRKLASVISLANIASGDRLFWLLAATMASVSSHIQGPGISFLLESEQMESRLLHFLLVPLTL